MKKIFILSMLTSFVMICSCQKQGSAAEQQLAQRKTELDTREAALDEREKALVERERRIQQLPPEFRALISRTPPDTSQEKAEKDRMMQERRAQTQLGPEDLQRQWQRNLDKAKMSGNAVFPAAEATSPTPSPAVEATSPSPSPTPE